MAKVDTTGDCWEWTGALTGSGYGVFALSAKRTSVRAHRFMWELATRCRAGTRVICHRCDNRRCVRPSHLFIGTHADNMMDMRIKGRAASGSNSARSKLTERDVQVIREDRANGVRQMDLAERFGVTTQTIRAIERRNTWRHVR